MSAPPGGPVADYGDPRAEARACREAAALFDFSFVRRARVEGRGAAAALSRFARRPLADMARGRIRYALRAAPSGLLLSDLTVWRHAEEEFEVMSGRAADIAGLAALPGLRVRDPGAETAILAVQGPGTPEALAPLCDADRLRALGYFEFARMKVAGVPALVGRLGYTGEAGVEIVVARGAGAALWRGLAERARPAGFAAADILRIEAGFPLFWNDFAIPVTAAEAGLAAFSEPVEAEPPAIRRICFTAEADAAPLLWGPEPGLARPAPGEITVTSACASELAGGILAMGYARAADLDAARPLVDPRGEFRAIRPVGMPLHDPAKARPRAPWRAGGGGAAPAPDSQGKSENSEDL
jgi:glycine cleavage system aminomethyltransferase T